jgi:hypothetical protein
LGVGDDPGSILHVLVVRTAVTFDYNLCPVCDERDLHVGTKAVIVGINVSRHSIGTDNLVGIGPIIFRVIPRVTNGGVGHVQYPIHEDRCPLVIIHSNLGKYIPRSGLDILQNSALGTSQVQGKVVKAAFLGRKFGHEKVLRLDAALKQEAPASVLVRVVQDIDAIRSAGNVPINVLAYFNALFVDDIAGLF